MSKSNFLRKAEVLKNGDYENFRYVQQMCQSVLKKFPTSKENPFDNVEDAVAYDAWKRANDAENWKECERLDHARCARVSRLRGKVSYMVGKYDCNFTTLTFTDEVLARTSSETRHKYVARWVKNFPCAIANVDFGTKLGREHYHVIVPVKKVDASTWKYGAVKGKTIKKDENSVDKVARYTAKLVNHAIKETTKGCRTIYSGTFGPYVPKDHLGKKRSDEDITIARENSRLAYLNDLEYDEMLAQGSKRQFYKQKDTFADENGKLHSSGFEWLTDADIERIDDIFMNGES